MKFHLFHDWRLNGKSQITDKGSVAEVWLECIKCGKKKPPRYQDMPAVRQLYYSMRPRTLWGAGTALGPQKKEEYNEPQTQTCTDGRIE